MKMSQIGTPEVLVLLGALISAFGIILGSIQQSKVQEKLSHQSEIIAKKSDEIARLNQAIASSVTGGDSFFHVDFILMETTAQVVVMQEGNYPVYDATADIVDVTKPMVLPPTWDAVVKNRVQFNVGNLAPSATKIVGQIPFPVAPEHKFNVFISARNGFFVEVMRYKRVKGKWESAIKVEKQSQVINDQPNTKLFEQISPNYPRNKQGSVNWE